MSRFYDGDGNPMRLEEWAAEFDPEHHRARPLRLATRTWNRYWVSTTWLGLDHSFGDDGPPLIFETMIFYLPGRAALRCHWQRVARIDPGTMMGALASDPRGTLYGFQARYTTKAQAMAGHLAAVEHARALPVHRPKRKRTT